MSGANNACCSRCTAAATVVCVDCDLVYCSDCTDRRHRKGAFVRHVVKPVHSLDEDPPCDECLHAPSVLTCAPCELRYCHACAQEVHKHGALQAHLNLVEYHPRPSSAFQSPFSTSHDASPFSQKRLSVSTDGGDDADSEYDLWSGWSGVFSDSARPSLTEAMWNPTEGRPSSASSSEDDAKPSFISDAFKDLALTHSSSYSSDDGVVFPPLERSSSMGSWEELQPTPSTSTSSYSQNELEDLFSTLASPIPTRHVAVRSLSGGPIPPSQCATVYQLMHGYGDIAQAWTSLAKHGLLLYTYFELKAASVAVSTATSHDIAVDFCTTYDPSTKAQGSIEITFSSATNQPPIPTEDLTLICATLGDVAAVTTTTSGTYAVEFNDARVVPRALELLKEKGNLAGHAFSVARSPLAPSDLKRLGAFQAAVRPLTADATARATPNPAHSPEKSIALLPHEAMWADAPAFNTPPSSFAFPRAYHGRPRLASFEEYDHVLSPRPPMPSTSPPTSSTSTSTSNQNDEFSLGIDRVYAGHDKRTTLMIRNIPNKYTQAMLLAEINERHQGEYDFFYLPIDFKNKCNMGYAFINFMSCDAIGPFYEAFNGQKWPNFNSDKVCAISYARLQGKAAMIARFQNSSLLEKHESYRPLVFKSSGPNKGELEPFPPGKQVPQKPNVYRTPYIPGHMVHHPGDGGYGGHYGGYYHPASGGYLIPVPGHYVHPPHHHVYAPRASFGNDAVKAPAFPGVYAEDKHSVSLLS